MGSWLCFKAFKANLIGTDLWALSHGPICLSSVGVSWGTGGEGGGGAHRPD